MGCERLVEGDAQCVTEADSIPRVGGYPSYVAKEKKNEEEPNELVSQRDRMIGNLLTVFKSELIRPEGGLNFACDGRIADLPCPKEITREMHGVHARHDK